jgi:hypothetical protein
MMTYYFDTRGGYEVLTYKEPVICPVWVNDADCSIDSPCADIIIANLVMPKMTGSRLFKTQSQRGCKVALKNKAFILGNFAYITVNEIMESECVIFEEPIDFRKVTAWLKTREQQMDLSQPLKIKRKEKRYVSNEEVACVVQPNSKFMKGIVVNMSNSGLCLKADSLLREEQIVIIHPDHLNPSQTASVRWAMKIQSGSYMMGLQYVHT